MTDKLNIILNEPPVYLTNDKGQIIPTTVVLSKVAGGKRINYIDKAGNVIKSTPLSYSPYKDKYKDE